MVDEGTIRSSERGRWMMNDVAVAGRGREYEHDDIGFDLSSLSSFLLLACSHW